MEKTAKDFIDKAIAAIINDDAEIRPVPMSPEQNTAANPRINVFVQANAGTGKTSVLVQRLLRILFNSPDCTASGILCLTYTNAGAGVMRNRILDWLRYWAQAPDDKVAELLRPIVSSLPVTDQDIAHARSIFFQYIDAPEMLKIKTFHSFCEEILHRFPLEAGIAPGWTLVSDAGQKVLLQNAFSQILNTTRQEILDAFERIVGCISEYKLDKVIRVLADKYKSFLQVDNIVNYRKYFVDTTWKYLGLDNAPQMEISDAELKKVHDLAQELQNGKKKPVNYLTNIINATQQLIDKTIDFQEYKKAYLKSTDEEIASNVSKCPDLLPEAERVYRINQYLINERIFQNTMAMFDLIAEFAHNYQRSKREQNLLDFDDLILLTHRLFSDAETMGWVLSQLDVSLSHILVDEAQDTSPEQWDVIKMLLGDFFADGDTSQLPRSLFVVGDVKQSIYAFQGADATAFVRARDSIAAQIKNDQRALQNISLEQNFRSAQPVLTAVDAVFDDEKLASDGQFTNMPHICGRPSLQGAVEIHQLVSKKSTDKTYDDYIDIVADKIASLVDSGVMAGDIMVLVQSRNRLVRDMSSALKRRNIAIAGLDRIVLPDFVAIRDFLNLIRWCLNVNDDYSLCCALKSPFFCLTEAEIYNLCTLRNSANAAIKKQGSDDPYLTLYAIIRQHRPDIYERLRQIRRLSKSSGPYTFVTTLLNTDNVRQRFIGAMGRQVIEPLEEFVTICLSYERTQPGTLYHFLKWFIVSNSEIKRDMQAATGVRIMTVHGSKGLEAKYVFLIDMANLPKMSEVLPIAAQKYPVWMWAPRKTFSTIHLAARADYADFLLQEYYRLLYVAMTRAQNELYIYAQSDDAVSDVAWHSQVWRILSERYPVNTDAQTNLEYIRIQ